MKYSLYKDLLPESNILSHVFLNCLTQEQLTSIALENKGKEKEEIEAREIEIEVNINGISVNPKAFFDLLFDQYSEQVENQATKLVKKQLSEKFNHLSARLSDFAEITESWADEINWSINNPLAR